MKNYLIVYFDNRFRRFGNTVIDKESSKTDAIDIFNKTYPTDFCIINVIEL